MRKYGNRFFVYYFRRGYFLTLKANNTVTMFISHRFTCVTMRQRRKSYSPRFSSMPGLQSSAESPRFAFPMKFYTFFCQHGGKEECLSCRSKWTINKMEGKKKLAPLSIPCPFAGILLPSPIPFLQQADLALSLTSQPVVFKEASHSNRKLLITSHQVTA